MANQLIFYKTPDGEQRIEVVYQDENFWMSQRLLAELFGVGIPAINKHLKNIFESGELSEVETISKMEIVRPEGTREVRRQVDHYNLDAIIAVGYRVNSYLHFIPIHFILVPFHFISVRCARLWLNSPISKNVL